LQRRVALLPEEQDTSSLPALVVRLLAMPQGFDLNASALLGVLATTETRLSEGKGQFRGRDASWHRESQKGFESEFFSQCITVLFVPLRFIGASPSFLDERFWVKCPTCISRCLPVSR